MAFTRHRSRLLRQSAGHVKQVRNSAVVSDFDIITSDYGIIDDGTTPYPHTANVDMALVKQDRSGYNTHSGKSASNNVNYDLLTNHTPDYIRLTNFGHLTLPDLPSPIDDALKVLAFTNPNRGKADVVQDVIEGLPFLPKAIFVAGASKIDAGVDLIPWWGFGMSPLIEDLLAMLDSQALIQQRLRELDSMLKGGGLSRKVHLGNYSASAVQSSVTIQSQYYVCNSKIDTHTVADRWGSVRWSPKGDFLAGLSFEDRRSIVKRILFGSGWSPKEIWDKLPWSWLVGWFSTLSLWMAANKSNIPVTPSSVCIMTHYTTQRRFSTLGKSSFISPGGGTVTTESKLRQVVVGSPFSSFIRTPNMGVGQSSILGAIGTRYLR